MTHLHKTATVAPSTTGRTIRWASHYDLFVKLLTFNRDSALRDETIRVARIQAGMSVLDVGCGTGDLTRRAKKAAGQGGTVYGIDAAPEMIEVAGSKARKAGLDMHFQTGVIEALDFPDKTFDVVLSSLMFHHLPVDLKQHGLAEIFRVLKPSGTMVIVDFMASKYVNGLTHLFHHNMESDLTDQLDTMRTVGFTHIESGKLSWGPIGYVRALRNAE